MNEVATRAVIFDLDKTVFATDATLHTDVDALLRILRRLGLKVGAVTSGDHRVLVRLEEAGIRHHFDGIVCTAHIDDPKAPAGMEHLLRSLAVEPQHTTMVSNLDDDMTLAKRAGFVKTIRVVHGPVRTGRVVIDADYVIEDIATVLDVIE
jgi:FMN phosphatase YigB (HAD superfamily)